jgi:hypothetical protein
MKRWKLNLASIIEARLWIPIVVGELHKLFKVFPF